MPRSEREHEVVLTARDLTVRGEEGLVYGPLDLDIPDKTLVFLSGRGGSGRTALSLTLSGRMVATEGSLTVLGETKPAEIRKKVAIAGVDAIDMIDRDVRVRDVLAEHRAWCHRWLSWVPGVNEDYRDELLAPVYGERTMPPLEAYVGELSSLDRILLRIALALRPARGLRIEMLILDDLEQVRELTDRLLLLHILGTLAEDITVIVNSVNPPPLGLIPGSQIIELFTDAAHRVPENPGVAEERLEQLVTAWLHHKATIDEETTLDDTPTHHDHEER